MMNTDTTGYLLAHLPLWCSLQAVVVCTQGRSDQFLYTNELLGLGKSEGRLQYTSVPNSWKTLTPWK